MSLWMYVLGLGVVVALGIFLTGAALVFWFDRRHGGPRW